MLFSSSCNNQIFRYYYIRANQNLIGIISKRFDCAAKYLIIIINNSVYFYQNLLNQTYLVNSAMIVFSVQEFDNIIIYYIHHRYTEEVMTTV